jgi:hypothetical protein
LNRNQHADRFTIATTSDLQTIRDPDGDTRDAFDRVLHYGACAFELLWDPDCMRGITMINHVKNVAAMLGVTQTAARLLARRLAQQTTLAPGQNLQMMDFAELGPPSVRAHLALPRFAHMLPSSRAVSRVLLVSRWIGTAATYALAIIVGIVGAAVAGHFTPS